MVLLLYHIYILVLQSRTQHLSLTVSSSGQTGPAAGHSSLFLIYFENNHSHIEQLHSLPHSSHVMLHHAIMMQTANEK